ncbi:MAG TPA: ATP-binding protein [Candidatus Sulfotelmatobacter sp.]|nr:ATP-binding protein [Candidatus Sulfotelmatobacter sp.]
MTAPEPKDERARLEALRRYHILDTAQESDFDEIVRVAARICETPIALMSLVDKERQWFKGRFGLEVAETPRRVSFCAHAILQAPAPMLVPDATRDKRFANNELVTGPPHIRFYASAPLVTPEGYSLGTLCVIDRKPRHLTPTQQDALQVLGRQIMVQLELRLHLAELSEANAELEGVSHAISHDVRAPLRAIVSLAQILSTRYASKLDQAAAGLVRQIERSGLQTVEMLEGFLRLLRLKKAPLEKIPVNMAENVASVLKELQGQLGPSTRVQVGDLPAAIGEPELLRQVWVNLIANALKFSRSRPTPTIEIGAREEPGRWVYFVRDNGLGFDMAQASRLWRAFSRLHGQEFEGTGLGLSIVKRIVQRHGGEVWAEGAPDQGATFYFALPK